jgi:uncharacterized protein (DUF2267 family)
MPILEPTRRSSRKVKRKTYDSMGSSEGEVEAGESRRVGRNQNQGDRAQGPAAQAAAEEWAKKVAARQKQMLAHGLRRKQQYHQRKRLKKTAIQREFETMAQQDGGIQLVQDDMEALFEPLDDFDILLQYQNQHNHTNSANGASDVRERTGHILANHMAPAAAANAALAAELNPNMISVPVKRDLQQATAFYWRDDWGDEPSRLARALNKALLRVDASYGSIAKTNGTTDSADANQVDVAPTSSFKIRLKF